MQCSICQKELFSASESSLGPIVCGSCLLSPLPPSDEDDLDKEPSLDIKYNLSYLNETEEKIDETRKLLKNKKSTWQVQLESKQLSLREPTPKQEILPVKKLKIKSNSVRGRMHPVGSLMLSFDDHGVAEFEECHLPEIQAHMRLRSGRLRLLDEPKLRIDPKVALVAARVALESARSHAEVPAPKIEEETVPKEHEVKKLKPKARKTTNKSSKKKSKE